MIEGIIYGLIGAWFLSLFGVDNIFVEALQPFVNFTLTTSHYYFVFGFVGMVYGIVYYLRNKDLILGSMRVKAYRAFLMESGYTALLF